MEIIKIIFFSMFIGAAIGGLTNSIAIYMLFRPYKAYKLGKWNLPFTPGLIPKRHEEMAEQLGNLVEQHLFTLDSLQQKLMDPSFQHEIQEWVQEKAAHWLTSEQTLNEVLSKLQEGSELSPDEQVNAFLIAQVERKIEDWWEESKEKPVRELLPIPEHTIHEYMNQATDVLLKKGRDFLFSDQGEQFLIQLIQTGMEKQGPLGSVLGIFLTKEKMVEKARPALVYWLDQPETKDKIKLQLENMTEDVLQWSLERWIDEEKKEAMMNFLKETLQRKAAVKDWFEKPLSVLLQPWKEKILLTVPSLVNRLGTWIYAESPTMFAQLGIATMVRERVLAFPLPKLEQMVRELASKELKMITWLGALLGGMIGIIQAIIISFFLVG
ncbi:DUF445 domain-containing protein [Caldalkalibacillus mannanilyticus]|uniref:DUF445 domain-containing protein n=1 Tax=Caldalkalibacillus mannanilyticus TaxID=1418 RepID=UPI0004682EF8|nr:DUF445 family protein [Caldalkalibacillus mannanilyticus]